MADELNGSVPDPVDEATPDPSTENANGEQAEVAADEPAQDAEGAGAAPAVPGDAEARAEAERVPERKEVAAMPAAPRREEAEEPKVPAELVPVLRKYHEAKQDVDAIAALRNGKTMVGGKSWSDMEDEEQEYWKARQTLSRQHMVEKEHAYRTRSAEISEERAAARATGEAFMRTSEMLEPIVQEAGITDRTQQANALAWCILELQDGRVPTAAGLKAAMGAAKGSAPKTTALHKTQPKKAVPGPIHGGRTGGGSAPAATAKVSVAEEQEFDRWYPGWRSMTPEHQQRLAASHRGASGAGRTQ